MKDSDREFQEANEGRKLLKEYLIADMGSDDESYLRDYDEELTVEAFVGGLTPEGIDLLNKELDDWNDLPQSRKDTVLEELKVKAIPSLPDISELQPEQSATEKNRLSTELVSDKVKEFLECHFERKDRLGKSAPDETIKEYVGIFREFILIVGNDLKCCDLSRKVIRNYEKAVWGIPTNHTRKSKYKNKSINEILNMDIPSEDKRKPGTINKHVMRVKQFLRWADLEGYVLNDMEKFLQYAPDYIKANEKKDPFTDDELRLLFNNEVYENGKFKKPSRYWLPLLALFTGARGEELAQLYTDDIEKYNGTDVYVIRLRENEERNQGLKNETAPRVLPIHSKLISLGFLDYVKSRPKEEMLFGELKNKNGKNYKGFGNNFNRKNEYGWKWKCGVTSEKTSFHSFRHNVVDFFANSNISDRVACAIVGHKFKGSFLVENYIKDVGPLVMQKAINKLSFRSVDWKKIKKLKW
ncbi:site-specific integrase [Syntrophotalea acetylenivorans]|nr:site-specific integrase [Syntrophotalea acetylenivorans]